MKGFFLYWVTYVLPIKPFVYLYLYLFMLLNEFKRDRTSIEDTPCFGSPRTAITPEPIKEI